MSPVLVFSVLVGYFLTLIGISYFSGRNANEATFFTGNKQSPWYMVAFAMIGASISGVTFISVPGQVGSNGWSYLQFILGNFVGYMFIAFVLIPLFYKMQLVSIYEYLKQRIGIQGYKSGAWIFIVSQSIGASFRLFLAANVLQIAFFNQFGIPFWATVMITILLIWLYTFRAGIKAVIWADTLQTVFLLAALVLSISVVAEELQLTLDSTINTVADSSLSQIFHWDWQSSDNFFKQFFAGIFITIVMNGLDQNVMQKNLTCKSPADARKNIVWFSFSFIATNILFLSLGVLIYTYASAKGIAIPARTDDLFPMLALNHFGTLAGILFLIGIIAAAYSSADSALTALTTSFCIDILDIKEKDDTAQKRIRQATHIGFSVLLFVLIIAFQALNNQSVVSAVFKVASFTYGPLLGLFSFAMFTNRNLKGAWVPFICILSPILCYLLDSNAQQLFNGYKFGFEILLVNGALTFLMLLGVSRQRKAQKDTVSY